MSYPDMSMQSCGCPQMKILSEMTIRTETNMKSTHTK